MKTILGYEYPTMKDIKNKFAELYKAYKNGEYELVNGTIEFFAPTYVIERGEESFRPASQDYIEREKQWYLTQSLNVHDIPGKCPKIWEMVSDDDGTINSNYGWMCFSPENGSQYDECLKELRRDPNSRRATMIFNRPSMHKDQHGKFGNMQDFCCTYAYQYLLRNGKLNMVVYMRSNDFGGFGINNDSAWAFYMMDKMAEELGVESGDLIWSAASTHVYERDFKYIEEFINKEGK